jgi:ribosomal-protein-alanine N-acetyltransferase
MIPAHATSRLNLRGFTPQDLLPLHAILSDPDVIRYLPRSQPWPLEIVQKVINRQAQHWQTHGYGWYAVECQADGELIGWCGLGYLDETCEVEIKYLLKKSHWGLGYATEGARFCLAEGFERLGLDEIVGLIFPDNRASRHVLDKLGLTFTGSLPYFGFDLDRYAVGKPTYFTNLMR